jgi:cytochrome b561
MVSRWVHWLIAALAVIVISLVWAIGGAPRNTPTRDFLLLLVYLTVAMHAVGALRHAIVKRDGVLERMLPPPRASKSRAFSLRRGRG